jgi:hypothetical protein
MVRITTTSPAAISADALRRAADDLQTLSEVFGWLNAMFASIADASKKEGSSIESRLIRIMELAGCGRYLAGDWEGMAENMADTVRGALNAPAEADHGN